MIVVSYTMIVVSYTMIVVSYTKIVVSYTMIVVYSRDHKRVGVAHKIKSPKKLPQFSLMTMRQYWLGKTKLKQAFRSTRNTSNKLLRKLKIIYLTEFSTGCSQA